MWTCLPLKFLWFILKVCPWHITMTNPWVSWLSNHFKTQLPMRSKKPRWGELFDTTNLSICLFILSYRIVSCPFHSILFHSILFYSILFYSIPFHSIPFYSILFYSIPLHSILFCLSLSLLPVPSSLFLSVSFQVLPKNLVVSM